MAATYTVSTNFLLFTSFRNCSGIYSKCWYFVGEGTENAKTDTRRHFDPLAMRSSILQSCLETDYVRILIANVASASFSLVPSGNFANYETFP